MTKCVFVCERFLTEHWLIIHSRHLPLVVACKSVLSDVFISYFAISKCYCQFALLCWPDVQPHTWIRVRSRLLVFYSQIPRRRSLLI